MQRQCHGAPVGKRTEAPASGQQALVRQVVSRRVNYALLHARAKISGDTHRHPQRVAGDTPADELVTNATRILV